MSTFRMTMTAVWWSVCAAAGASLVHGLDKGSVMIGAGVFVGALVMYFCLIYIEGYKKEQL